MSENAKEEKEQINSEIEIWTLLPVGFRSWIFSSCLLTAGSRPWSELLICSPGPSFRFEMVGRAVRRTRASSCCLLRVQNKVAYCETSYDFKVILVVRDEDGRSTMFILMWFQHQRILCFDNESKAGTVFVLVKNA